jgi:hypothetical protein
MTAALDPKSVADTNPAVDLKKLEKVRQTREFLLAAGIEMKASYRIEPALKPAKIAGPGKLVRLSR